MATIVKKQLALLEGVTPKYGAGYGAEVDPKLAEATALRMCEGTTSRPHEMAVLWTGDHLALVYHKAGSYSDNGGSNYVPAFVELVSLSDPRGRGETSTRRDVHSCEMSLTPGDQKKLDAGVLWSCGRITPKVVETLALRAKVEDEKEPARVQAMRDRLKAENDAEQAKERRTRREQAEREGKRARLLELGRRAEWDQGLQKLQPSEVRELGGLVLEFLGEKADDGLPHAGAERPCSVCHPGPNKVGDNLQCRRWQKAASK